MKNQTFTPEQFLFWDIVINQVFKDEPETYYAGNNPFINETKELAMVESGKLRMRARDNFHVKKTCYKVAIPGNVPQFERFANPHQLLDEQIGENSLDDTELVGIYKERVRPQDIDSFALMVSKESYNKLASDALRILANPKNGAMFIRHHSEEKGKLKPCSEADYRRQLLEEDSEARKIIHNIITRSHMSAQQVQEFIQAATAGKEDMGAGQFFEFAAALKNAMPPSVVHEDSPGPRAAAIADERDKAGKGFGAGL